MNLTWGDLTSAFVVLMGIAWGYVNLTTVPNPYGNLGVFLGLMGLVIGSLVLWIKWLRKMV